MNESLFNQPVASIVTVQFTTEGHDTLYSRPNADMTQINIVDEAGRVRGFLVAGASCWLAIDSRGRVIETREVVTAALNDLVSSILGLRTR